MLPLGASWNRLGSGEAAVDATWDMKRWRKRVYEVLERDAVRDTTAHVVHVGLILLILGNAAGAVLETVPEIDTEYRIELHLFEMFSFLAFSTEYALRLWAAPEHPRFRGLPSAKARFRYALTANAIIDLLSVLPFGLVLLVHADLRTLALFRLVRFMKLARYSPGLASLVEAIRNERHALVACFGIIGAVVLISASAMYIAEREVQPKVFGSIPLAAWWAVVTVTTVGYGDAVPVTLVGRLIAAATMLCGLIMLALPVGIIASSFADVIRRRDFVVTWGMVARVPLFADLDAAGIGEILRILSSHTAQPGEILARRGDPARSMYFILSGEVQVELEEGIVLLGEGQFFGEMALLSRTVRSGTIRCLTRTQLLILDGRDLEDLMARRPEIRKRIDDLRGTRTLHPLKPRGDILSEEMGDPRNDDGPRRS